MVQRRGFGTIIRTSAGRYRARYADPEGRTKISRQGNVAKLLHSAPHTFDTRMDAEAWLTDERRLLSTGRWTPPGDRAKRAAALAEEERSNTFEVYSRGWLAGRHDLRPSSVASYRTAIEKHLVPVFGDTALVEITPAMVRSWFNSYGDRTPTARAHAYQVLRTILAQAEDDDVIPRNPCRIKAGGRARVSREPEVLTLQELLALADAMPKHHRAITLVCGLGGLRFGEAAALRRRDVNLDAGIVTVARTAVRADRKKQVNEPKTAAGHRTVALPPYAVEALREHMRGVGIAGGRDALIFPGKDGELLAPTALYGRESRIERRGKRTFRKPSYGFYAAREAIGRPTLHWHDLRRTAATLGAEQGASVAEMQRRLGHATADMALHYQRATADRDRAIAEGLQARIEGLTS